MVPVFVSPKVDSPEDSRPRQKKEQVVLPGVACIEARAIPDQIPKLNDPQRCEAVDDGYSVRVMVSVISGHC